MSEKPTFKTGDVVVLNSGSRLMTVECVRDDGKRIDLLWFEGAALHRGIALTENLVRVTQ